MPWKFVVITVMVVGVVFATGCAPKSRVEGVPWVTRKHKAADAKLQRVTDWPALRVDAASIALLDEMLDEPDLAQAKALSMRFVDQASADARQSTRLELERLDADGWREINARYYGQDAAPDASARAAITADFETDADMQVASLRDRLMASRSTAEFRRTLRAVRARIEPSVKTAGRIARLAPWLPFTVPSLLVIANINAHEWRGPQDAPFASAVRYVHSEGDEPLKDQHYGELLARWAPVIVQEVPAETAYPPADDQIGRVAALGANDIAIDVSAPTIYAYARQIRVHRRPHVQLVYTHWYPEHPALKKNDPEHGKPEGVTLRITLDAQQRPALMETVYNCGCYHRLYPSLELEAEAKTQYGAPQKGKALAIERNVAMKIDMIVPKAVAAPAADTAARPVIRCRAGWHGIVDVGFVEGEHVKEVTRQVGYTLRPYDELERLPLPNGGGVTSMFYDNGLVKKAQRPEGVFFTPAGLLSAGQPRQRGTQLIHWDHYDFDDPHLFERTLRLPASF